MTFVIRPPECFRKSKEKPFEEKRGPSRSELFKILVQASKDSLVSAGQSVVEQVRTKIEKTRMPLEDKMMDARMATLTEEEALELLHDPNPLVRLELAWNETISGEILEQLKHDPDVTVSTVARRRLMVFE